MTLSIHSLSVAYRETEVLHDIHLEVHASEVLALVGPNGAGKSTLVRAISGSIKPTRGMISVKNQDISHLSPQQRGRLMAVVPQARQLPPAFTVKHTVLLGRTPYLNWLGQASQKDLEIVQHALRETQLVELGDRRIDELSGGEQQRVLLARAIAQETPVLLLDEPTTHLDLQHQSNLLSLIRILCHERALIVLVVLHDLNLASIYADRVALLSNGRVFAAGSASDVLTADNLHAIYKVPVQVIPHPMYGTPMIVPDGRTDIRT